MGYNTCWSGVWIQSGKIAYMASRAAERPSDGRTAGRRRRSERSEAEAVGGAISRGRETNEAGSLRVRDDGSRGSRVTASDRAGERRITRRFRSEGSVRKPRHVRFLHRRMVYRRGLAPTSRTDFGRGREHRPSHRRRSRRGPVYAPSPGRGGVTDAPSSTARRKVRTPKGERGVLSALTASLIRKDTSTTDRRGLSDVLATETNPEPNPSWREPN